jgi:hypothetical protein
LHTELWYEVNEYVGKWVCFEGFVLVVLALIFLILPSSFGWGARVGVFFGLFVVLTAVVMYLCMNRAKAFSNPTGRGTFFQL